MQVVRAEQPDQPVAQILLLHQDEDRDDDDDQQIRYGVEYGREDVLATSMGWAGGGRTSTGTG